MAGEHAHPHASATASALHGHDLPGTGTPQQRRALKIALALTGSFLIVEAVAGVAFGSLALLADAGHMLTDVAALGAALLAFRLAARPASRSMSYGWQRAELLAALANAALLLGIAVWIVIEAVRRLGEPVEVRGVGLLVVAAVGLVVNLGAAWFLARAREGNLNVRAAMLHVMADALGSAGAILAGLAILLFDATWADPAVSLLIALLIMLSVWRLLREVVHILLEGTPTDVDPQAVAAALHAAPEVDRVHHLHVWRLSSGSIAMSAHIVASSVATLHEAQLLGDRLKDDLAQRFGIDHATLELECHDCRGQQLVSPEDVVARRPR